MIMINFELPRHFLLILCTSLVILLSMTVSFESWRWHEDWQLAHHTQQQKPTLNKNESLSLIEALPDAHLFGQAVSKGLVPVTNLQLHVTGIVKAKEKQQSKAYISISTNPSKIYKVGDTLPYGVKVYDISSDTVILNNDGRLEKLPLQREKLEFKPFQTKEQS